MGFLLEDFKRLVNLKTRVLFKLFSIIREVSDKFDF